MYKPLPESVTIKPSGIHDLGLFADQDNHANEANCVKAELRMTDEDLHGHQYHYKKWNLITSQDIKKGEELTIRYTFYKV